MVRLKARGPPAPSIIAHFARCGCAGAASLWGGRVDRLQKRRRRPAADALGLDAPPVEVVGVLGALEDVQRQINALLQRPHPERRLSNLDVALHLRLRVGTLGVLPYLLDVFRDELDLVIENTADTIRFSRGSTA